MAENGGSPQLTWPNIISTVVVILAMVTGAWTLLQSQRASDREYFTGQIESTNARANERDARLASDLAELRERRKEFIGRPEYSVHEHRIEDRLNALREALKVLETTRPTTGELQATNANAVMLSQRQEERIRALEQYLLGQSQLYSRPMAEPKK